MAIGMPANTVADTTPRKNDHQVAAAERQQRGMQQHEPADDGARPPAAPAASPALAGQHAQQDT